MPRRNLVGIFLILLLVSCAQSQVALFQPSSSRPVGQLVDAATTFTVPGSSQPSIRYSETDDFDRVVYSGMKGQTPTITVDTSEATITRSQMETAGSFNVTTPRIYRWIWKVRDTEGASIACEEPRTRFIVAVVMLGLRIVASAIRGYVTYGPAENYHARSVFDAHTDRLKRVEFVRRDLVRELTCDTTIPGT